MSEIPNYLTADRGDGTGAIRFMAAKDNWVMVRRPSRQPWCEPMEDWLRRPLEATAKVDRDAFRSALVSHPPP